ncbi:MAG: glycoside hydrolase family 3 N-terminal domain-containing protein [Clostridia bacterium]|nr:glycoside hydrolase family 3 N-terminal domain-containing protein [Clostridia bacterium]
MKRMLALLLSLLTTLSLAPACGAAEGDRTAEELLAQMTLEQKIGQMIMPSARKWSDTPEDETTFVNATVLNEQQLGAIARYNLAGVCLFAQNLNDTEQILALTDSIQQAAFASATGIGALLSADQEGGYITRLRTGTSGIGNMALAATGDAALVAESAAIFGTELAALGIQIDFAPDADVNSNPENPVIGVRSFGDDPQSVASLSAAYLQGLAEAGVIGCLKHFPGHGDTDTDSHTGLPLVAKTKEQLAACDLVPFAENAAAAEMIMTAHIQFPEIERETAVSVSTGETIGVPATMSRTLLTEVLRNEMGYDGVIVTDSLQMDAIALHFEQADAAKRIINAGADLILMPVDLNSQAEIDKLGVLIDTLVAMVRTGEIAESRIDEAVLRVLKLKERHGLFAPETRPLSERTEAALAVVGSKAHHDREWEMAKLAVTVKKNAGAFPLTAEEKEGILYLTATTGQLPAMDFALTKLAEEGVDTAGISVTGVCYNGLPFADIADRLAAAKTVVLTTSTGALRQTDASNPDNTKAVFVYELLAAAKAQGKKVVLISTNLPYDAEPYGAADAVLACYNPSGFFELPTAYDGHTVKYGANVPAALCEVLRGTAE